MKRLMNELRSRCQGRYLTNGYHTWHHALEVEATGIHLAQTARSYGIFVDEDLVAAAALTHDLDFGRDPSSVMFFDGKERRPARYAEEMHAQCASELMTTIGFPSSFIREVVTGILGTYCEGSLTTSLAKITTGGDLRSVGYAESTQFVANTHLLHSETQMLQQRTIPFTDFVRGSINYLGRYLARRNQLTPGYFTEDGRSAWHMGAITNIARLAKLICPGISIVADLGGSFLPAAAVGNEPVHGPDTIHIVSLAQYTQRKSSLAILTRHYQQLGAPAPMSIAIPDEGNVLSLPGNLLSELYVPIAELWAYMTAGFPATELRRVLKPHQGTLHLYDKRVAGLESPPYKETGNLGAIVRWLAPAGFQLGYDTDRPFGWEAVFGQN